MALSISIAILIAVLSISICLGLLNLAFWYFTHKDRAAFWLAAWLFASAIFAFSRLLQYADLPESMYLILSHAVLGASYLLVWFGYELGNAFIHKRPNRWEQIFFFLMGVLLQASLWAGELVLTHQAILRETAIGDVFHGYQTGPLYMPVSLTALMLSSVPMVRLALAKTPNRRENLLMASGFSLVILFSLSDFFATSLNLPWIRLSDFGYLPLSILFTYIQLERNGGLYQNMNAIVQQRTAELLEANATLRAEILERERAEQEQQRRLKELSVLNTVAAAGAESTDLDEFIARVTSAVGSALYPDNCGVLLADDAQQVWKPHPSYQGIDLQSKSIAYPYTQGIAGRVISSGKAIRIDDIRSEPLFITTTPKIMAEIAAPIIIHNQVFGCLNAESCNLGAFSESDERLLNTITGSMATAIEKILLLQTEKQRRMEAEVLYSTTHDLVMQSDLLNLLQMIVVRAARLLNTAGGGMYLCDPEKQQVRCVVSYNTLHDYTGVVLKYGEGSAGKIAETGQSLIIDDYRTWEGRSPIYEKDHPFISMLSIPMIWQERILGVIHVLENEQPRKFTQQDMQTLTLFANQAAAAVENARLFEFEQRRSKEALAIAAVARDISASLQLEIVLERVAAHAQHLLKSDTCAVYTILEGQQTWLDAIAAIGPDAAEIKRDRLLVGKGILGNVAKQRKGEIVNKAANDPRALVIEGTDVIIDEHLMGAPIISKERLTGLIAVWRLGAGNEFISSDLDFLTSLAQQAAIAIDNARLFEDTRHRLAEVEILQSIAAKLRVADSRDEIFPIILTQLINLLHFDSALVDLIDPESNEIVSDFGQGLWKPFNGLRTPLTVGGSGWVIANGKPYITSNASEEGVVARSDMLAGIDSAACVPITSYRQMIGTLWVGRIGRSPITQEEINLLIALGEMAGNTVQRMKLHERTVQQAEEIALAYDLTLEGWARALELRDKETEGHSRRVTAITLKLAKHFNIAPEEIPNVRRGVLLHDIGKMGVPDNILKNPGALTAEEWEVMKNHPSYAYELLKPIEYLHSALDIPYCHHEKWDGTGYPRGLKGEEIPLTARIFAVVDVWDALTSDRPYRSAWDHARTAAFIASQAGTHFDPAVVTAFQALLAAGEVQAGQE